jgi:SAM-dependent methyltransferase
MVQIGALAMLRIGGSEREWLKEVLLKRLYWVDLRDSHIFKNKPRIRNSTNICWSTLPQKLFMLPNRTMEFGVIASSEEIAEQSLILLRSKGWTGAGPALSDSDLLWSLVSELGLEDEGDKGAYLFEPSPFLVQNLSLIEESLLSTRGGELRCCDIGCGSGRNAAYLASRGKHRFPLADVPCSSALDWHWRVDAVDSFPAMLSNLSLLSVDLDCSVRVALHSARITGEGKVTEVALKPGELARVRDQLVTPTDFASHKYDLVLCIRFMERAYLAEMLDLVREGGYLLISTFVSGGEVDLGIGSKGRVLEAGELSRYFGSMEGVEIIEDQLGYAEDGRRLGGFLCRRVRGVPLPP